MMARATAIWHRIVIGLATIQFAAVAAPAAAQDAPSAEPASEAPKTPYQQAMALKASGQLVEARKGLSDICTGPKSADTGRACTNFGVMAANGEGGPKNDRQAAGLYELGCNAGSSAGCNNLGYSYFDGKGVPVDQARARTLLNQACDLGMAASCARLGDIMQTTAGGPADPVQARALLRKACDLALPQGKVNGCNNLALMIANGTGGPADATEARRLYGRACEQKDGTACYNYAKRLRDGIAGPVDRDGAIAALTTACTSSGGISSMMRTVACGERDQLRQQIYAGSAEATGDRAEFQASCAKGSGLDCYNYGVLMRDGSGGARDLRGARAQFNRACQLGISDGCHALGFMAKQGEGGPADDNAALAAYDAGCKARSGDRRPQSCSEARRLRTSIENASPAAVQRRADALAACNRGDPAGCYNRVLHLSDGRGGPQNLPAARQIAETLCTTRRHPGGCALAGDFQARGAGGARNLTMARASFETACQGNFEVAISCRSLSKMLSRGEGGPVNIERATQLMKRACDASETGTFQSKQICDEYFELLTGGSSATRRSRQR